MKKKSSKILRFVFKNKNCAKSLKRKEEHEISMGALLQAQEAARKWISIELHDGVAQSLKASLLLISELQHKMGEDSEYAGDLKKLAELGSKGLREVKGIGYNLAPIDLENGNLHYAIMQFSKVMKECYGKEVSYTNLCIDELHDFPKDKQSHIYRLIQEALTNALWHSNCTEVSVLIRKLDNKKISIFITDDGVGIKKEILTSPNNFGINGMKQRVAILNGTLQFDTEEGEGTVVKIII